MNAAARAKAIARSIRRPNGRGSSTNPAMPAHSVERYVAVLALIPAVSGFIGACSSASSYPGVGTVRAPICSTALFGAIFGYVMTFAVVAPARR